jgi:ATP-binding cassette subfamily F protein 3
MALVNGHNLAKSFGAEDIFAGVTVAVPHGARIALVGPNGSGKTTLLNLLTRRDEPSEGTVTHARDVRIGFLPQRVAGALDPSATLWGVMLEAVRDLIRQEERLAELADALSRRPGDENLLHRYGEAQDRFAAEGGYEYPARIRIVLAGLGFDESDHERPIGQLSGGQKTRALLARLLLEDPDLLILDEPTNHLDIRAIEWLEGWLRNFEGALLMVSHDRYFMDSLAREVWELIFGRVETYRGNYSAYVAQREARHARLLKEWERQQEFIEKEQDYIQRNIAGQNTKQAQGRRKRLERFLRDEAIARPREERYITLNLTAQGRSGDKVLMTTDLAVGYPDEGAPLFRAPDITLYRGECAALIGPNGSGKSTFLKTILGRLDPLAGAVRWGAGVEIGYFAQAHEELQPDRTALEEILSVQVMPDGEARSYLARFLFRGDDVYKPIAALSGGERGRVALAKLALGGANVLLLDEPTNHLDIPSQEILEAVLSDYAGTILLVSHDRYLIRHLATQIWALAVPGLPDDTLVVHEGPYDEYLAWRAEQAARQEAAARPADPPPGGSPPSGSGDGSPSLSPYMRQKRVEQVEARIAELEAALDALSDRLEAASAAGDVNEVHRLGAAYSRAESDLESLLGEWESLAAGM